MNLTRGAAFLPASLQPKGNGVGTWKGRPGKTLRDRLSGAWSNRLSNLDARRQENRSGPRPTTRKAK